MRLVFLPVGFLAITAIVCDLRWIKILSIPGYTDILKCFQARLGELALTDCHHVSL